MIPMQQNPTKQRFFDDLNNHQNPFIDKWNKEPKPIKLTEDQIKEEKARKEAEIIKKRTESSRYELVNSSYRTSDYLHSLREFQKNITELISLKDEVPSLFQIILEIKIKLFQDLAEAEKIPSKNININNHIIAQRTYLEFLDKILLDKILLEVSDKNTSQNCLDSLVEIIANVENFREELLKLVSFLNNSN